MNRLAFNVLVLMFCAAAAANSQGNFNIEFLGNQNKYASSGGMTIGSYSGCWGYTAPNGREYALLGVIDGTSIVDITDAPNLTEVVFIPGPFTNWREMRTYQHYAYVVNEHNSDPQAGMQIIDLSNLPASASLVKTFVWTDTVSGIVQTIPHAHTVSIEGKYLYLNGGGEHTGMRILDLTDPVNPVKAGFYDGPYIHDSFIRNDTVFASAIYGEGLDIIDVRNKANPTRIKLLQYPSSGTHNAWTTDDGNFLFTTDEIGGSTETRSLKVWDIRDIQNPTKIDEYNSTTARVHNVFVKGTLAYVSWYADGMRVFDISNPADIKLVGQYDTFLGTPPTFASGAWGAYPYYPSGKSIVSDMQTGLYVFRYTGPVTKIEHTSPTVPKNFSLHQNYPNPFNPTTTIRFELPNESSVTLRLFDLLGQEVRVLSQGTLRAGTHTVRVDASGLASGVYLYRLETPGFVHSRLMAVMK